MYVPLDLTSPDVDKGDESHDDPSEAMDIYAIDEPGTQSNQQMP